MKQTIAFECEFCSKIYKNPASCKSHEYRCYHNPRTKSCASCAFSRLEEQPFKPGVLFRYKACLVNMPVAKEGLQTRCPMYLDRKYAEDPDIMLTVRKNYKAADQTIMAWEQQHEAINRALDQLPRS